jgi:xanthine dehydrogenase YagT iron-sulfur-binding subunit
MIDAGEDLAEVNPSASSISRRDMLIVTGATLATAYSGLLPAEPASASPAPAPPVAAVRLTVNGTEHHLSVDPRQSVLDVIRETLQLTGTKKGCNQGACGACTVMLDGKRVNSCLTLAVMHDGASITTIEGLKQGEDLHPLQAAFIENEGFQCGYCTSGQIMSAVGCIAEGHAHDLDQIRFWMSGNICRCGAYPGICNSVHSAAQEG